MARKQTKRDLEAIAMIGMIGGVAAAGKMMDNEGHQQTMAQDPTKCDLPSHISINCKIALESAGVKFGPQKEGDKLFLHAELPPGWKFKRTDHYMYTDILDERGRKRASQMYKAAFYDRDASLSACFRYCANYTSDDHEDRESPAIPVIKDSDGKILWRGEPVNDTGDLRNSKHDVARQHATVVLHAVCPEYAALATKIAELEASRDDSNGSWQRIMNETGKLSGQMMSLYWDVDRQFPESLSKPPSGDMYQLSVAVYRDGNRIDQSTHSSKRFDSNAKAIKTLVPRAKGLLDHYDEVTYTICKIGEEENIQVSSGTLRKPRPKHKGFEYDNMHWNGRKGFKSDNDY